MYPAPHLDFPISFVIKPTHSRFCPLKKVFKKTKALSGPPQRFELPTPENNPHSSPHGSTRQNKEKTEFDAIFCATLKRTQNTIHFAQKSGATILFVFLFFTSRLSLITTAGSHRVFPFSTRQETLSLKRLFYFDDVLCKVLFDPHDLAIQRPTSHTQTHATHISRNNVPCRLPPNPLRGSPHTTRLSPSSSLCGRKETHTLASSTNTPTTNNDSRSVVCIIQSLPFCIIWHFAISYTVAFARVAEQCEDGLVCAVA